MSKMKEHMEIDIVNFFEAIENQDTNSKVETLRNLIEKYVHLRISPYMMDAHDLREIISNAKSRFATENALIFLKSGGTVRQVTQDDLANYFVIKSTISHLKKKDCLSKLPMFEEKEGE